MVALRHQAGDNVREGQNFPRSEQHHELRVHTRRDSHDVQGKGSVHGLDQPVVSAECTRRPRWTARSKRGLGIHS